MKLSYYFIALLLLSSCNKAEETKFDWLLGNWERTNNDKENKTYEYWIKKSDIEYQGLGCTLKGKDTVFKENIHLIKEKEQWIVKVIGVNENPTPFPIISFTETSFISENTKNDFPKKIMYTKTDKGLKAIIADDDTEIPFYFIKRE